MIKINDRKLYFLIIVLIYLISCLIISINVDVLIQNKVLISMSKTIEEHLSLFNEVEQTISNGYLKNISISNNLFILLVLVLIPLLFANKIKLYQKSILFVIPILIFYFSSYLGPSH
ncbi:hypothetical protein C8D91_0772 [Marinicella litoralis]|uniref:Uncharacterized protein n=1 Tax=Marinicella litoralis TaxID=644220 RepID=A0A4R6XVQ9_9GAMM|nr:hypothetical protein C8D91_0772 [Marinicella litoralis]